MSYVAPSTRSTGLLVTAAIWNQDVVDNVIDLDARNNALTHFGYNPVINSDMFIWQRGTSFAAATSGICTADRWFYYKSGAMVNTVIRSTSVPSTSDHSTEGREYNPFTYSMLVSTTTADASIAAGDFVAISQKVEGYPYSALHARQISVGFWVRATITGTYCVSLRNSAQDRSCVMEYTVDTTDTWEYKMVTFPASTAGTWDLTNGIGAYLTFTLAGGSTYQTTAGSWAAGNYFSTSNQVNAVSDTANSFRITGVHMYPGNTAMQYANPNYAGELLRCYRYYWKWIPGVADSAIGSGATVAVSIVRMPIVTPVMMRTTPTFAVSNCDLDGSPGPKTLSTNTVLSYIDNILSMEFSGLTTPSGPYLLSTSSAAGYVILDAEL